MVEDIMGNAKLLGNGAGIANVLTRAAATDAAHSFAMVVEL